MELNFNFYNFSLDPPKGNALPNAVLYQQANRLFSRAYDRGRLRRLWARLSRRSCRLGSLSAKGGKLVEACYEGRQEVPFSAIRGSENRESDFDDSFHPLRYELRQRWVRVALAWLQGRDLPPVELIHLDGKYYVRDGHHRVSVARHCGRPTILAEVTQWEMMETGCLQHQTHGRQAVSAPGRPTTAELPSAG